MKPTAFIARFAIGLCAICSLSATHGDEPSERFLQALRDQGYHDIALDYLQDMESSPLASAAFKQSLPFERAQTLIDSTSRMREVAAIEQRLDSAEKILAASESSAANAELKAQSQKNQGDLLFRRANLYLNQADNERLTAGEKESQFAKAREFLKKALDAFGRARTSYKTILDNSQVDLRDANSKSKLKKLRETFTVVRMNVPQIVERYADTLEDNNPERKQSLERAATEFEELWGKYPRYHAGIYSCFFAARCHHKMGSYTTALNLLQELLALGGSGSLKSIKRQALALSADCWSKTDPYPFNDVIANVEPISQKLTRNDLREPDWQRIQMELARAYHAKATDLKLTDPSDGRIKNFFRDASKLIKGLARLPGKHRDAARDLMAKWNLNISSTAERAPVDSKPVNTFAEAKQRGLDLVTEIEGLFADVSDAKRQLQSPSADPAIKEQLSDLEGQLKSRTQSCLATFDRALLLADSTTTREDRNQIRYLQSICHFVAGNYFESALIGEFLVSRYPTIAFSKQAGSIAVRSYAAMHDKADPESRDFERERLQDLAQKVSGQWPGSTEASEATSTLTKLLLSKPSLTDAEIATASQLIDSIPADSPKRALLDIKLGTKLWFVYQRKKKAGQEDTDQLATRLDFATEYLSSGVKSFTRDNLSMDAVWGSLFLVNAHLESGNVSAAVKQLESETIAPVDLVKLKHPVVFQNGRSDLFVSETYKSAGKVYLAALGDKSLPGNWADKALAVVRAMQTRADKAGDQAMKKDVSNMYRLIAVELEKQLDTIKDPKDQQAFVKNLNEFLNALQSESTDPNTIIWTGKTYMSLGDMFVAQSKEKEAKSLYASAASALDRAAKMGIKEPRLLGELKRQQALAKRGSGKFEDAIKDLIALLKQTPNSWQLQLDAASTLQRWGTQTKTSKPLAKALGGTERFKDPDNGREKNLIWGWTKLANALKSNPDLSDAYFKSVFAAVSTRFEYGVIEKNSKVVQAAQKRLKIAKTKTPALGGPQWKPKFEALEAKMTQQIKSMN